jgi:hypothetical protein
VLWSDVVVIEGGAIGQTLEPIAESETATRSSRKPAPAKRTTSKGADRARRAAAEAGEGDETPAKSGAKAKAKSAAKKSATKKPAAKKAAAKSAGKAPAAKKGAAKKSAAKKSSKKKGDE